MNYVNLSRATNWPEQVIQKLPSLVELDFSWCSLNDFKAPLNDIINNTHSNNLAILDLSSNNLQSSVILRRIFQLDNLIFLDLSLNLFEGEIPRRIANLCRLQMLDLGDNKLHGEVLDAFGNMSDCFLRSLQSLRLFTNQLSGSLTHQFREFKSLQDLDLTGNSLSGEIPNNIGNLSSSLEYLSLASNRLTGNLPENVGKLSNLIGFDITDNMLEGVVTETHFAHLSKLKFLYASRNHLIFNVSPNWIPPFKLETLRLGSLNLGSGTQIPSWIEKQKKYIFGLDLSCTGISGNVPSWIWNIRFLNLSHNQLHGKIPFMSDPEDDYYGLYRLIYLSSNNFSGSLPQVSHIVTELDLSNNSFSGNTSHLLCDTMTNETNQLVTLHLGGNLLTGELPDCFMKWPSLRMLNLGNNNLSGTIPNSIGFLAVLQSLNLYGNKFSGQIPFSIQNCTQLVKLDLSSNNINGSVPTWIGTSLSKLKFLILRSNKLSGEITTALCQLSFLQILDLSGNRFSGIIPWCVNNFTAMTTKESWGTFGYSFVLRAFMESASVDTKGSELQYDTILSLVTNIDLSNNHLSGNSLSGEIPSSFRTMSSLSYLNLSCNNLTGHLTHQFGDFKSVRDLDLSGNSLSGEIPNNIGNLSSLEYLNLGSNKLTGNLPESVGQLFNLIELHISDNLLEGVVTETHFAHLSRLKYLYVSRNQLTLKVSPDWIPPFKLETLRLGSLNLGSGSRFPSWLETQEKTIVELDLSCTGIFGNVPSWIWNIRVLNLSHNKLQGKVPMINDPEDGYYGMPRFIYLSSNNFSGSLPRVSDIVSELDLSNNSFTGDISHFLCDTTTNEETNQLEILHLGENQLTGELPDCFMKWPSLRMLNLGNNNFSGSIPSSIGFLADLMSLNLYSNKFSGHMPFSMLNCTQLVKVDLADNDFVGSIPKWIGTTLSSLRFLILRSNKLSGDITSTICQLSSLQILDVSDNFFSGVIPRCVDNFTAMTTRRSWGALEYSYTLRAFIESASVDTKGRELQYDTILSLVTNIDLSNNHLSGDIPKELTSLVELRSLNLSDNHLTGMIPDSIGNMKQLESLDFSINSLSGEIPSSFATMSSLSYLNLSYNNLTGKIPESTQLQGFNKSNFIGNSLCGPPLTNSCNNEGDGKVQDQEGDKPEIEWLYVFVSLGHAVGLSGFLTTLYLKKSWRDAYYEFLEDMWDTVYVYFYVKWRRLTRGASGRNS
ncbi:probable leucine-rich repeat receptor-like protein kinase at5g63930 [Phtheirospermum japonicum]|uniref:Probable leucine-rich repeat receptor-like protein kinase at5g63930 n=1 Tax=Phtheirospermum japonicum TaxID=374723 RepID=A0A830CSN5_9LAMI|nr:probable leucine-rich repeat receptor-like protein kinase at5g63930 [Phtheirospermum japonicum]